MSALEKTGGMSQMASSTSTREDASSGSGASRGDSTLYKLVSPHLRPLQEQDADALLHASSISVENESQIKEKVGALAKEVDLFVRRASSFGAMKLSLEYVCGVTVTSNGIYSKLIRDAEAIERVPRPPTLNTPDAELEKFYVAFCNQIEDPEMKLSFVRRGAAKVAFHFLQLALFYFLEDCRNEIENYVKEKVKDKEANDFEALKADLFQHVGEYLSHVKEAYQQVAGFEGKDPPPVSELLQQELAKPVSEQGYESSELYKAFTDWLIQKSKPTDYLRKIILHDLANVRFASGSFLSSFNVVVSFFTDLISNMVTCILRPSLREKLDLSLHTYAKKKLSEMHPIDDFIKGHLRTSEKDQEKMLKNLLKSALSTLKADIDPHLTIKTLPEKEQKSLEKIVSTVFDLLDYSKIKSLEELRTFQATRKAMETGGTGAYLYNVTWNAVATVMGSYAMHDLTYVRSFIASTAASAGGSSIATNLQKTQMLVQVQSAVQAASQALTTMDDPPTQHEKDVDEYLKEVITESLKSAMTIFVCRLKGCTAEFVETAQESVRNLERFLTQNEGNVDKAQFDREVEQFRKRINAVDRELKKIIADLPTNSLLGEENKRVLETFQAEISQFLEEEGPFYQAIAEVEKLFTDLTTKRESLEKMRELEAALDEITTTVNLDATLATIEKIIAQDLKVFPLFEHSEFSENVSLHAIPSQLNELKKCREHLDILLQLDSKHSLLKDLLDKKALLLRGFLSYFWYSFVGGGITKERERIQSVISSLPEKTRLETDLDAIATARDEASLTGRMEAWDEAVRELVRPKREEFNQIIDGLQENLRQFSPVLKETIRNEKEIIESYQERKEECIAACMEVISEINRIHDALQIPTTDYYKSSYGPWLMSMTSAFDSFLKPLLRMILDPKHQVFGVAHGLMTAVVGPKQGGGSQASATK